MSADSQGGAGRREVAYRLFAAEYDDADFEYSEDDDERSPNYVVTPTGARVNRLFVVGVLTEVEPVNEDMVRARIVDPTGAFVAYAGQYQPDAQAFLERADPPTFVALTGKARTFEPEDSDVVYTSIRPESINEVDAETRDRWTVQTARQTLDRIATFVEAREREERSDDLRAVLESEGVDVGLATGIPLALDHYGTTTGYLDALRDIAVQAAEVVAGEREEVEPLELAPDEGGEASIDVETGVSVTATTGAKGDTETAGEIEAGESGGETTTGQATAESDETGERVAETATDATATEAGETGELGDFDAYGTDETGTDATSDGTAGESVDEEAVEATDEMYELDEEERQEIEEEFGTEFSTGNEVEDEPETEGGEAEIEREVDTDEASEKEMEATEEIAEAEPNEPVADEAVGEDEETETDGVTEGDTPADIDPEEAVVEVMEELDDGDGADREAVIETAGEEYGIDAEDAEDAIQDALMSGKCYEPGDDRLKAI